MKEILLTRGMVTLVDDADYDELMKHKWYASFTGQGYYAIRNVIRGNKRTTVSMHREILNLEGTKFQGDHIDLNRMNNQRNNLRVVTIRENQVNRNTWGAVGYKGVVKIRKGFNVKFTVDGKTKNFGTYKTEKEAAIRADEVMREIHGVNGRYNFPREGEHSCRN